jgi:ComF family protein
MGRLDQWGENLLSLFFPQYCPGCGHTLGRTERAICVKCLARLPRTCMHEQEDNPLEKMLWGRVAALSATAFLHMPRHSLVHRLLHDLKYHQNQEVGKRLGQLFGAELASGRRLAGVDCIIPVPLHPRKQRARGYNQCHCIAEGMTSAMGCAWDGAALVRTKFTQSQTRKHRFERWQNVGEIFRVANPGTLAGRHVLLLDDIITTGATVEACASALTNVPGLRLSVAALAIPVR